MRFADNLPPFQQGFVHKVALPCLSIGIFSGFVRHVPKRVSARGQPDRSATLRQVPSIPPGATAACLPLSLLPASGRYGD